MSSDINISVKLAVQQANRNLESLNRNLKTSIGSTDRLANATKGAGGAFKVFAGNLAAIGVAKLASTLGSAVGSVFDFGVASVKVAGEMETLRTQFEVLTGSAGAANKAVKDLQEFAARTPFQFKDLAQAQQRLLSFGFTLEQSSKQLEVLGDVSAASGGNINELALIFGQVNAAGKLTGERLLQFQERAIPIGPALAKTMGVAESAIRDLVSQGKVDFATFEAAFQSLTKEGEFAFDGMAKRSQTLEGRISTLSDNFQLLQANIGERLAPALKAAVSTITEFIQRIQVNADFQGFLQYLGDSIPSAIQFTISAFSFVINAVLNTIKIFNLFRSGVTTALEVVIGAFTSFVSVYAKVINALGLGDTAVGRSINSINNFRTEVLDSLSQTADGFAEKAANISQAQETVNSAIDNGTKFILESYQTELEAAKAQQEAIVEIKDNKIAKIDEEVQAEVAAAQVKREISEAEITSFIETQEARLAYIGEVLGQEEMLRETARARELAARGDFKAAEDSIEGARIQARRNDIFALQKFEELSQRERISNIKGTLGTIATLQNSGSRKLFEVGKAAAIGQATIDGFAAVQKALASAPPPLNFALAAAVGVATGANIAQIAAQQPRFQNGGIVPGQSLSGDRVQARVNSGEMILNRQQQANLFRMAQSGGGGNQQISTNITVELDGEVVGRAVSRQVANGLQLGEVQ